MNTLRRLHLDETGMETIQSVAILTVAAIALAVLKEAWHDIRRWFRESVEYVVNWQGDQQ